MSESNADLPALLRELDEPGWLERSKYYDRDQAAMHFGVLVARLEEDFAARCTAEQDTQEGIPRPALCRLTNSPGITRSSSVSRSDAFPGAVRGGLITMFHPLQAAPFCNGLA